MVKSFKLNIMKKAIFFLVFSVLLASCRTNEGAEIAHQEQELTALREFNAALLQVLKTPEVYPIVRT